MNANACLCNPSPAANMCEGSPGTVFLLAAMWASSSTRSTREPSTPLGRRSVSTMWLSAGRMARELQEAGGLPEDNLRRIKWVLQEVTHARKPAPAHCARYPAAHPRHLTGAARHEGEAAALQALGQRLGVAQHLQVVREWKEAVKASCGNGRALGQQLQGCAACAGRGCRHVAGPLPGCNWQNQNKLNPEDSQLQTHLLLVRLELGGGRLLQRARQAANGVVVGAALHQGQETVACALLSGGVAARLDVTPGGLGGSMLLPRSQTHSRPSHDSHPSTNAPPPPPPRKEQHSHPPGGRGRRRS